MGYFKEDLETEDKDHFITLVEEYGAGEAPYVAVIKMLEFFTKKYRKDYLQGQYYFDPYPKDLALQRYK